MTHKVNIGREAYQFNISEGEELVLTCNATNRRPVAWHYTDGGTAREVPGEELRIPSVAQRHAGDYRCKAEAGVEKHVVVTVLFPPKVHVAEVRIPKHNHHNHPCYLDGDEIHHGRGGGAGVHGEGDAGALCAVEEER